MPDRDSPARAVVRRPMNDHGTMTVELRETNETRHVCEYATPELRRRLAVLSAGAELRASMARIGVRANVWRVSDVVERPSSDAGSTEPDGRMRQPL